PPRLRARMTDAAVAVARAANYRNAGTIEFLVDGSGAAEQFYFLEMNTRLQVEHPVTEEVAGVDLVRAQLLVAGGEPLPWTQDRLAQRGHVIEARVYAEDPSNGFLPQAGRLERYRQPQRPGVRVDSGVAEGGEVSIYYDPMIAKVIATAETRDLAIARLVAALGEFAIEGIRTNLAFLVRVLESDAFRTGQIDTAFLDREGTAMAEQPTVTSHEAQVSSRKSQVVRRESRRTWDPWDGAPARAATRQAAPAARRRTAGAGAG